MRSSANRHYFNEKYIVGSQFFPLPIFSFTSLPSSTGFGKSKFSLVFLALTFFYRLLKEFFLYLCMSLTLAKLCLGICFSVSAFYWNLCHFVPQISFFFPLGEKTILHYVWLIAFSIVGAPLSLCWTAFVLHIFYLCNWFFFFKLLIY